MNTPARALTVEDFNPAGRLNRTSSASLVRLKGCWLKQAGFHPGALITVINTSPGVLELRVGSPVQIAASFFTVMNRLEAVLQ